MGADALGKIGEHLGITRRYGAWARTHRPAVHVPVDAPAANFPLCARTRNAGGRIVHLVAPQMWAWGAWRVRKLRRLTDHVLCLLPFEEAWFRQRDVPATFIGHPVFGAEHADESDVGGGDPFVFVDAGSGREGGLRLVVLPGSRPAEIARNTGAMLEVVDRVRERHADLRVLVVAADETIESRIRSGHAPFPPGVMLRTGGLATALDHADLALVCSGTATLDVTRHRVPMTVLYRMDALPWFLVGRWVIRTPNLALPNLVANERIVPEFIPHFGSLDPVVEALSALAAAPAAREAQRRRLGEIAERFAGLDPAARAVDLILLEYDRAEADPTRRQAEMSARTAAAS